jgi:hypothetical protein
MHKAKGVWHMAQRATQEKDICPSDPFDLSTCSGFATSSGLSARLGKKLSSLRDKRVTARD